MCADDTAGAMCAVDTVGAVDTTDVVDAVSNVSYKFMHTERKSEISYVSYQSAIVIQALKALGKDGVTVVEIRKLSKLLNQDEKQEMLKNNTGIPEWIYRHIKAICELGNSGKQTEKRPKECYRAEEKKVQHVPAFR
jgi:hypothetical protein